MAVSLLQCIIALVLPMLLSAQSISFYYVIDV